jgi:hypothetical protein
MEITFESLENKPMREFTEEERIFVANAYLRHFDTLRPRERLIGYMVVFFGIPATFIGDLSIDFRMREVLHISIIFKDRFGLVLLDIPNDLKPMVSDYLETDERIVNCITHLANGENASMSLFAPKINGKGERLHDCRTFLRNAGKAIGFNAKRVILHKLLNHKLKLV